MKVNFLRDYSAKTPQGSRPIPAGTLLDLAPDKAAALIAAGIAEPAYGPPPHLDRFGKLVIPLDCPPRFRWWQGGQSVAETVRELFEERAAILEHDGGMTRQEAERRAAELVGLKHYRERTPEDENHPQEAGFPEEKKKPDDTP